MRCSLSCQVRPVSGHDAKDGIMGDYHYIYILYIERERDHKKIFLKVICQHYFTLLSFWGCYMILVYILVILWHSRDEFSILREMRQEIQ